VYRILSSAVGYDGGRSGISEYMNQVIPLLAIDHKVDLVTLKTDRETFSFTENNNLRFLSFSDSFLKKPAVNMLWHLFILPYLIDWKKYDFIFLPAGNRRLMGHYKIPSLITFHDLSQFHIENKYDMFRMFYIRHIVPRYLKRADQVFAISGSTKDDMIKFYNYPESKIDINYNGYNSDRFNSSYSDNSNKGFKLPTEKKYLLYVARIEHPGKNHLNLIKAYEMLTDELKNEYDLVLAGSLWKGSEVVEEYWKSSSDKSKIHMSGFVKDEALPELYRNSSLYVFPSYYEGFGLPLLEAMGCGVPVICSNSSSLPEIGGDAVISFSPDKPEEIALCMEKVLSDTGVMERLTASGLARVKEFSWDKHVETIIKCYETKYRENI